MNELIKLQKYIMLRNGIEIQIDEEMAINIETDLCQNTTLQFIKVAGELLNVRTIDGIFSAKTIAAARRRKQGLPEDKKENLNL